MATRPAWTILDGKVKKQLFEFEWNSGFAVVQKQRNVRNLHAAIKRSALEVSTKSEIDLGKSLSAFCLTLENIPLECIFQASKVYEKGGPYKDILWMSPKEAKGDERRFNSGRIIAFNYEGDIWSIEPKTAFYDYIYMKAAIKSSSLETLEKIGEYQYFTDIEFNPNKSINCQARAVTILKLLLQEKTVDEILSMSKDEFIFFHKQFVKG